jgi:hypothetical protein
MRKSAWIEKSFVAASLGAMLFAGVARADVVPPEQAACQGKSAGDTCMVSGKPDGTCAASKCSRIDYASWDRDMMAAPPTVMYDCLLCGGANPADMANSATPDLATTPDMATASTGGGGSCAMGHTPLARAAGPWMLAGLFSLLLLGRRRRD